MNTEQNARLAEIFRNTMSSVQGLVADLDTEDDDAREDAQEAIHNDALSVEVRDGWRPLYNAEAQGPTEYRILLTTGGPAAQIVGELNDYGEPESAYLEVQDWFLPWARFPQSEEEDAALMAYVKQFYFGE